jgi:hypothetical protein
MHHDDIEQGLFPRTRITVRASPPSREVATITNGKSSVVTSYLEAELNRNAWMGAMSAMPIVCFCISGLIDAVAFNTWGCVVGMQTGKSTTLYIDINHLQILLVGNTVFLALGITRHPVAAHNRNWTKSLTAIGFACLGCAFFNFVHRYPTLSEDPSSRKRWVLVVSWMLQCIFITIAALFTHYGVVSNQPAIGGVFSSGSSKRPPRLLRIPTITTTLILLPSLCWHSRALLRYASRVYCA